MAILRPPSPAFRQGTSEKVSGEGLLTTNVPAWLTRKGYRATRPAGAEVTGVAGVPSDATVPGGIFIAQNTLTGTLYVKRDGAWRSVDGEV